MDSDELLFGSIEDDFVCSIARAAGTDRAAIALEHVNWLQSKTEKSLASGLFDTAIWLAERACAFHSKILGARHPRTKLNYIYLRWIKRSIKSAKLEMQKVVA